MDEVGPQRRDPADKKSAKAVGEFVLSGAVSQSKYKDFALKKRNFSAALRSKHGEAAL